MVKRKDSSENKYIDSDRMMEIFFVSTFHVLVDLLFIVSHFSNSFIIGFKCYVLRHFLQG